MEKNLIVEHYNKESVLEEILNFSKDKWLAIVTQDGFFRRYYKHRPLKASSLAELKELIAMLRARSIFASVNLYNRLETVEDIDPRNVYASTPTIDIDGSLENWKSTIQVTKEIIHELNDLGVSKSIIVKWSGNGCHVHLNHKGFSKEILLKYNPVDLAYAIVELIIKRIEPKIFGENKGIKLENKIDDKRVFTCPLSFHRELDVVC
ncbi:MAG TPA: hypothetical protein VKU94_06410, partial [Geobacterales bacterium]|nr:hypothetical protein [Geobacterales bacterium]